jgi:very-short-patch-repair endonuclease
MNPRSRRPTGKPAFEERYAAADVRRLAPTPAEAAFAAILDELGNGALRGEYKREWPVGEWLIDFYFPSIMLAIEVDGGYHRAQTQWRQDLRKTADLEARGITVLRLTNAEVFGERGRLVKRLRAAWREAVRGRAGLLAKEPAAAYRVWRFPASAIARRGATSARAA